MIEGKGLIVNEWIETHGGAEKVLESMVQSFPNADVLCSWNDSGRSFTKSAAVRELPVVSSRLLRGRKALSLPVLLALWRHQNVSEYQWVLASSHMFSHHINVDGQIPKLVYSHTPARYLWETRLDRRGQIARPLIPSLCRIDRKRANEATAIAANSKYVAARIEKAWGRESHVIYPPVDVERIRIAMKLDLQTTEEISLLESLPSEFILGASRLVPYKRMDTVIFSGEKLGLPVVIAGAGPDLERLKAIASRVKVPVNFVGRVADRCLYQLYRRATAYVFPGIEDFGIMPIEAMAAGARVVVNRNGGASETVKNGENGVHCEFLDPNDIVSAINRVETVSRDRAKLSAVDFSKERFEKELQSWIAKELSALPG